MAGMDQLYNVQFDKAAASFDKAIAADPNDPRGYFYRANVHLWSYVFDKRPDQLQRFMAASERAVQTAERRLKQNPNDNLAKLFLGMSYGYRVIGNARAENIMAAVMSARTCYERLNQVVRADPNLYDAYLGLGIFHFVIGAIPDAAQVVAGLTGLKGDAALGLREIETAATRGKYFRTDAQLISALLTIYHRNDLRSGLATLEGLAHRYPRNVALLYAIGSAWLDQEQPDRAIPYFERVNREGNNDFRLITTQSLGRLGMAWFARNDFARARTYLQQFLRNGDEPMFRANAWYLLGRCNEMLGNRDLAVKAYERVRSTARGGPEDHTVASRARRAIAQPMSDIDKQLLRALNGAESKQYAPAGALARGVLAQAKLTVAQRALANYVVGRVQQETGDPRGALKWYAAALSAGRHDETWIAPYSHFHMAECWLKLGDRDRYAKEVGSAGLYKGYDREVALRFKLQRDVTKID